MNQLHGGADRIYTAHVRELHQLREPRPHAAPPSASRQLLADAAALAHAGEAAPAGTLPTQATASAIAVAEAAELREVCAAHEVKEHAGKGAPVQMELRVARVETINGLALPKHADPGVARLERDFEGPAPQASDEERPHGSGASSSSMGLRRRSWSCTSMNTP